MNPRDQKHCKALLDVLHEHDGQAVEQTPLFGEFHAATQQSQATFLAVLALCDARGWLTGVQGKFSGRLWAINDEGEIARLQL